MNLEEENNTLLNHLLLENKRELIAKILVFALIIVSLFTLTTSPIVWYDEVCMASESLSFFETGKLNLTANPYFFTGEVLHYGPVYFLATALSFKFFGFGIFQYRLVAWISALIIIYLLAFRKSILTRETIFLFVLLLMSDMTFLKSSHSGRMETLAIVFSVATYLIIFQSKSYSILKFALIGLFSALAVLVTPRSGFLLVPVFIQLIILLFNKKLSVAYILSMAMSSAIPVLLWFGHAYDFSLDAFINEIKEIQSVGSGFAGTHFRISAVQAHLVLATLVILAIDAVKNKFGFVKKYWYFFSGIVLFYLLVKDFGPYSVYIIWIFYVLIMLWVGTNKKRLYLPIILLFINFGFMSLKYFTVLSTYEYRNMSFATVEIAKSIPEGSLVVGDMRYFYSVHLNGSTFRYNEEDYSIEKFEKLQRENDDYDYLILSSQRNRDYPNILRTYEKNSELELVGTIALGEPKGEIIELILSKFTLKYNYSGSIYKRKKD